MKEVVQTHRSPLLIAALGFVILLLLFCGSLYKQNKTYQQENRRLIIENDSIMSVNIELSNSIKKYQTNDASVHKTGIYGIGVGKVK